MPSKGDTLSADHLFSINAGTPDMVNLTTLDEESMVSNLQERFRAGLPYTLCGQICVSVNPFRWLPIYEESVINRYHSSSNPFVTEPPHVYPVAHAALTRLQNGSDCSQSILVSGESGAGKTEATKICMKYLAQVDSMGSGPASARARTLTDRVLQSSPILEAFGNAQTVRNDNSSRFGKFLQLRYSESVRQMGANIRTYLLERSRVVRPPHKEKNYHVLYALVGGATPEETQQLGLLAEEQYDVLAEGNGRVPQKERAEEWQGVLEALSDIGFSNEETVALARALSCVLALTLLKFDGKDGDEGNRCAEPRDPATLARAASCLQVDEQWLLRPLNSRRTYLMTGEMYVKQLDEVQAADAADALAKAVYGRMFDAVVRRINALLDGGASGAGGATASPKAATPGTSRSPAAAAGAPPKEAPFIGILDIFGFESFETNSFEQICINCAPPATTRPATTAAHRPPPVTRTPPRTLPRTHGLHHARTACTTHGLRAPQTPMRCCSSSSTRTCSSSSRPSTSPRACRGPPSSSRTTARCCCCSRRGRWAPSRCSTRRAGCRAAAGRNSSRSCAMRSRRTRSSQCPSSRSRAAAPPSLSSTTPARSRTTRRTS